MNPSPGVPDEDLQLLVAAPLVTSRYQAWRPADGLPIRTTVGYPRFWRGPALVQLRELTPYGIFGTGLSNHEARLAYRQRVEVHAQTIVARLAELARQHPGEALVVLCFENVHAGEVCHRRWFAEWFEERFGIQVPELPAGRGDSEGVEQPQLPL